jgi:hypothetical protein
LLIEMINGGIKEIYTDTESYGGCETCDWGSEYINEFTIYLTKGNIQLKVVQMYDYALSEGYMMKLFLENIDGIKQMEEKQFFLWLKEKLENDIKEKVDKFELETSLN